jgi:glucokinase
MANEIFLGVDIGGTKVAAGLVDAAGQILFKSRVPMVGSSDAASGLKAVKNAINAVVEAHPQSVIKSIGVSSPGPLDPHTGVVINPPNLPCWRNFPLAEELRAEYKLPVRLDNDANAAGLAEALWGAGRGYSCVFYATIGTGIGSGITFDRRLWHGRTGAAAEGGHITIDFRGPKCGCGKLGCIEALASGPAIASRARAKLTAGNQRGARLLELAGGNPSAITGEVVGEAWRAGDALAAEVLRDTADLLTIWLGNIIDLLEPDVIVIGGGVGELISGWFDHIRTLLPSWSINQRCHEIPLLLATYKTDAGIAGAAALCLGGESASAAKSWDSSQRT